MSDQDSKSRALLNPNYASVRCIQPMPGMIHLRQNGQIHDDSSRVNSREIESNNGRRFVIEDDLDHVNEQYEFANEVQNHNYYEPSHENVESDHNVKLVNSSLIHQNNDGCYENVTINSNQNANKNTKSKDPGEFDHLNGDAIISSKLLPKNGENKEMFEYMPFEERDEQEDGNHDNGGKAGPLTWREILRNFLHSKPCHIAVIVLVIVDCILVITEILLDLKIVEVGEESEAQEIVHFCSIAILSVFMLEIIFKLIADWHHFIHHKIEVLDAIVVVVAFAFDIGMLYIDNEALVAIGLLVFLRLWRVVRIVNGIILTVKNECDERVHALKAKLRTMEEELQESQAKVERQEKEITKLKEILEQNGIHVEEETQEGDEEPQNGAVLKLCESETIISLDT